MKQTLNPDDPLGAGAEMNFSTISKAQPKLSAPLHLNSLPILPRSSFRPTIYYIVYIGQAQERCRIFLGQS
jgi:hypothetical protein